MAFVHHMSHECAKTETDIFTIPPTQTAIEGGSYVEYNPISSISHGSPIEFSVIGSGQDYIDLSNTQLYIKAQIVKANGDQIGDDSHVAPINLLMHSLFSEIDIKLNDTLVTSSNNTYIPSLFGNTVELWPLH